MQTRIAGNDSQQHSLIIPVGVAPGEDSFEPLTEQPAAENNAGPTVIPIPAEGEEYLTAARVPTLSRAKHNPEATDGPVVFAEPHTGGVPAPAPVPAPAASAASAIPAMPMAAPAVPKSPKNPSAPGPQSDGAERQPASGMGRAKQKEEQVEVEQERRRLEADKQRQTTQNAKSGQRAQVAPSSSNGGLLGSLLNGIGGLLGGGGSGGKTNNKPPNSPIQYYHPNTYDTPSRQSEDLGMADRELEDDEEA
jgi:hypothetical protein